MRTLARPSSNQPLRIPKVEKVNEMRKKSFFEEVVNVLKKDARFVSEKGELLRNAVFEAAQKMDAKLLKALRANEETRKRFFTDIGGGITVFDKQQFGWVVSNRAFLSDSYTRFRTKIGLAIGDDMISSSRDVELVFPFKDCVLEKHYGRHKRCFVKNFCMSEDCCDYIVHTRRCALNFCVSAVVLLEVIFANCDVN